MKLITIDFETYYSKTYSLTRLTTEAYIRDPQFEVIGVGVLIEGEAPQWMEAVDFMEWAYTFPWSEYSVLAHHAHFDGAILSWHYKVRPAAWLDTLSMARAVLGGYTNSFSLDALTKLLECGTKGDYPARVSGWGRNEFTEAQWNEYGEYCINDCNITRNLFSVLARGWRAPFVAALPERFPTAELKLIDKVIRMYVEPVCIFDPYLLKSHHAQIMEDKKKTLRSLTMMDSNMTDTAIEQELRSDVKFAYWLNMFGVQPPSKISPATRLRTYAFAKTDKAFRALLEHPRREVRELVGARLKVKSSIEETRTKSMLGIEHRGAIPMYYNYSGANQTHRFSGGDGTNFQNLPRGGVIRDAICAPEGHQLLVVDSSNIEARVVDILANELSLMQVYNNYDAGTGPDVYCYMAGKYYNREIVKGVDNDERQLGKTLKLACFAADTKVLTHTGTKRIVDVHDTDLLWDGVEWVKHQGLIYQGVQRTLRHHGVTATPDHDILTENGWRGWLKAHTNPSLFRSALSSATLPLSGGGRRLGQTDVLPVGKPEQNAPAGLKGWLADGLCQAEGAPDVINALRLRLLLKDTGRINMPWMTTCTDAGCVTGLHQRLADVITPGIKGSIITEVRVSTYVTSGEKIVPRFLPMSNKLMGGITRRLIWIGQIIVKATNRVISGLSPDLRTQKTGGLSKDYKNNLTPLWQNLPVYDLKNSGPGNRYTIVTDAGPILVHNCGFSMAWARFQETARIMAGIDITDEEAKAAVHAYRTTHSKVVGLWKKADAALEDMQRGVEAPLDISGIVSTCKEGFVLPNGLVVKYPELRKTEDGWVYSSGRTSEVKIYGGKAVENIVQALARIIVMEQCMAVCDMFPQYPWVMTSHDEGVWCVPDNAAEDVAAAAMKIFRTSPAWWSWLPVNAEAGISTRYGWAK